MNYKNYPLVRKGTEVYYGRMSDPYVVYLKLEQQQKDCGIQVARKVEFYQMSTDLENPKPPVQRAERENLYEALDVAAEWLNRANQTSKEPKE